MNPTKIEFEIGKDIHERRITLSKEKNYMGKIEITITAHAANQRDETMRLSGLNEENILKMAEAIQSIKNLRI